MQCFLREMRHVYKIDEYVHCMKMIYEIFGRKWLPYRALVEETNKTHSY